MPSLHDVLWWALAIAIVWLAAAIVWVLVTPVSPLGAWRPRAVHVMPEPARAAVFASVDPFNRQAKPPVRKGQSQSVTSLALTLYGTRGMPGGGGSAIVAGADGVQQVYRVGDEVQPGVKLAGVAFDYVTLDHNGAHELLYIDQSKAAPNAQAVVAENPVAPPRAANAGPDALTVDTVRKGITFAPYAGGSGIDGLEVQPSGDGAAFRAAGFEPGDIVTAIGGKPVTSGNDIASLVGQLKPGASISVSVNRGGRQLPLAITLAQ
ncbi:type II secretion system protein N [Novosphingobium sp. ZN18A2]|uniref:type II secretion system protein N n=1 Tax=Novosphingobium sp. ZN18A2 TaxID=3079861 RepID=UPI0030CDCA37